jgi:cell division protease FtsH
MAEDKDKDCWDKSPSGDCGPKKEPPIIKPPNKGQFRFSIWFFVAVVAALVLVNQLQLIPAADNNTTIEYSDFKKRIESGEIKRVEIANDFLYGYTVNGEFIKNAKSNTSFTKFKTVLLSDPSLIPLLDSKAVEYVALPSNDNPLFGFLLSWIVPLGLMFLVWRFFFKKMGNMGQNVLSFGQNKSQIVAEGDIKITFDDVAGVEEAKAELVEVVDFLKSPKRYTDIGGKIPTGVLLVGAPGTGKTLLAKAIAGEAKVTFFKMSGADFVEMFVGVGAARVRDLFKQAREKSPCIIFIDELDAIGKSRISVLGGNDEREQTLNQLLVEMDGFDSRTGVIILAATNRPEILDPALLRPGRFDRQVFIDKPDLVGREAILAVHVKNLKMDETVNIKEIARSTPGFVGADLANIANEAALLAVRAGRTRVAQKDFEEAIEKVVAGLSKKNKLINKKERKIVAYHETGHAIVAHFTPDSDPVQKISIVPRGMGALGYTLQMPTEDRFLMTEIELLHRIDVLLGGRASEEIVFGEISTGAGNDLVRASDIARKMITEYGMSVKFRNVVLPVSHGTPLLGEQSMPGANREYSEATQQYIDEEITKIVNGRYKIVTDLLQSKKDLLEKVAKRLLEIEILTAVEFAELAKN